MPPRHRIILKILFRLGEIRAILAAPSEALPKGEKICSIVRPPAKAGSPAPPRSKSRGAPSSTAPMSRRPTARRSPRSRRSARKAFESGVWRDADPTKKKKVLLRFAELIREHCEELALLETLDVGKPIANSLTVDAPFCANCIQYY